MTRRVQNLHISDPSAAPAALPAQPPSTMGNSKRPPQARPKQQPKEHLRSAQCGPDPAAHEASTDQGLMQHMGQKRGRQQLHSGSFGQLRRLDRAACMICGAVRSCRCNRCDHNDANDAASATAVHHSANFVSDTFQDRRQPGHQNAAPDGAAADQQPPQSSQPMPPGDPLDDSPVPNYPSRDITLTERDKQVPVELRRASAMALPRCVVSRYATDWAESLEGAVEERFGSRVSICAEVISPTSAVY